MQMSFTYDRSDRQKDDLRRKSRETRRKAAALVAAVEALQRESAAVKQISEALQGESQQLRQHIHNISRRNS